MVFDASLALLQLGEKHHDRLEQIQRFEAADDDRLALVSGNPLVWPAADDGGNVARADKAVQSHVGGIKNRANCWDNRDVIAKDRKIPKPLGLGTLQGQCSRRRGGLKTDGKKHYVFQWIHFRELESIRRRIDDSDVDAARLVLERAALGSGNPHHVAEGGENHIRIRCDRQGVVDPPHRQNANGAAGPVDQLDILRENIFQPETVDGVRVAAADLHEPVVAFGIG